jgi:hypothetical protein
MRDHHNAVQHRAYDERPQSDIVDTADYYECVEHLAWFDQLDLVVDDQHLEARQRDAVATDDATRFIQAGYGGRAGVRGQVSVSP